MSVTSLPLEMSSRARFHPTFPPPAMMTYTALPPLGDRAEGRREHLDGVLRRADRVQPLLLVPGGARRVHDAHDHAVDLVVALGDLRDGEVRVVAVGRGDEDLRLLHARLDERVDLHRVTDGEAAAGLLPRGVEADLEALVGQRVLVEDGDGMTGRQGRACHGRPDAAGADDEDEHPAGLYPGAAAEAAAPAPAGSRAGGATRMTSHGALETTYFVASPTKLSRGPPRPPSSAPPRIRDGSSAARTIAWTPRRRASSTIAAPARRARTVAVATSTPSYSSPTALARRSVARAASSCASGSRASIGSAIGTSKIHSASIVDPALSRPGSVSSPARRPAVWIMSSSSGVPVSGTRIEPNSSSSRSSLSAASGTMTRLSSDLPCVRRYTT